MAKQLLFDDAGRQKVAEGIRKLAGVVKVTLGPRGRNVILEKKFGAPQATRDGVTVAKEIELEDPFENMGAKLANEAAEKSNSEAGDGTTTAVVLTEAIYLEGLRHVAAGLNPQAIKRGIDKAVAAVVEEIGKLSRPVKDRSDYLNVAMVSTHFDEPISEMIADAIQKVGKEGVITVEESKGLETKIELVEGMQFDKGYISPYFMNKPDSLTAEYEDCYLLLTDKKLSNVHEVVPILEQIASQGAPLLVVAEEVEGEALAAIVINKLRGILKVVAVKAPAFGDRRKAILQDVAVLTGGTLVSQDTGMEIEKLKLKDLGRAKKVIVEKERTTIVGGAGSKKEIEARISELRTLISKTTSDYDREKYEERLAKLVGGVAIVQVGGPTESEMKERKFRVDDAVHAVKAAAQEGIVPGGGVAYLRALPALEKLEKKLGDDEAAGVRTVRHALESPLRNIARNAGFDPSVVVEEVKQGTGSFGFDAGKDERGDMFKMGVVDPAKVCRLALQHAASVSSMLLTARTCITELKEEKKKIEGAVK
jgi:chaperonin GroEL